MKALKVGLNLTESQKVPFEKHSGSDPFVWNYFLASGEILN